MSSSAQLILKSGEVFYGETLVALEKAVFGEVVFTTGMVGYVETLTDPSYAGQIIVFTYPLMGNYGVSSSATWESQKIHAKAVVVDHLSPFYSHIHAERSLGQWLIDQHIPIITGIDTRALTKALRTKGVVPGVLTAGQPPLPQQFEDFETINWVKQVSIKQPVESGEGDKLIIVVDCGMKENIFRSLSRFPVRIKRVPFDYDFTEEAFDGVFISNGPGDPVQCQETIRILRKAMALNKPMFGICLGMQLMALAAGGQTYKLPFGHRSHNQPCLHLPDQRCYLTSQNHGYAVDESALPEDWRVSFRNLNDGSVAGIEHEKQPFFSVQFHPEAAPGPEDTQWLFDKFYQLLQKSDYA